MLIILLVATVLASEDHVTLMRQLVEHVSLIKQVPQSSIKFQRLDFVYVVVEVLDGCLVLTLQYSIQQQSEPCATSVRVVHHVHALPLSRCVSLIVATILYSTCPWHPNVH